MSDAVTTDLQASNARLHEALAALMDNAEGYDRSVLQVVVMELQRAGKHDLASRLAELDREGRAALTTSPDDITRHLSHAQAVAENERMRTALEFYANPESWSEDGCGRWEVPGVIWTHDDGRTAREALGIPEPEGDED